MSVPTVSPITLNGAPVNPLNNQAHQYGLGYSSERLAPAAAGGMALAPLPSLNAGAAQPGEATVGASAGTAPAAPPASAPTAGSVVSAPSAGVMSGAPVGTVVQASDMPVAAPAAAAGSVVSAPPSGPVVQSPGLQGAPAPTAEYQPPYQGYPQPYSGYSQPYPGYPQQYAGDPSATDPNNPYAAADAMAFNQASDTLKGIQSATAALAAAAKAPQPGTQSSVPGMPGSGPTPLGLATA